MNHYKLCFQLQLAPLRIGFHTCMSLGFVIISIGYSLLVPPPWVGPAILDMPGREYLAMVLNGLGAAFSYVPIYPALLKAGPNTSPLLGCILSTFCAVLWDELDGFIDKTAQVELKSALVV